MLKKKQRLSRADFTHLLKCGRRIHGQYMTVVYNSTPPQPSPCKGEGERLLTTSISSNITHHPPPTNSRTLRAGVVVSKKVARKAVERNRLRRQVYHALGELLPSLEGCHLAVLLKPTAKNSTKEIIQQDVRLAHRALVRYNCHT